MSENDLDWYQRTLTCIREEPGLISEKGLDLHQTRTCAFIREEPWLLSGNDLGFDQRITWTFITEGTGLVSEDVDLHQKSTCFESGSEYCCCYCDFRGFRYSNIYRKKKWVTRKL